MDLRELRARATRSDGDARFGARFPAWDSFAASAGDWIDSVVHRTGWMPIVAVAAGIGLALAAMADALARAGSEAPAGPLLWLALLLIFIPILWRLLAEDVERGERITLVVLLGIAFFLIKVLQSPNAFTLYDETLHLRTLNDLEQSGRLATDNPLLPVSLSIPGWNS